MKKFIILTFFLLSIYACNKIDKTTDFEMDYTAFFTISKDSPLQTDVAANPILVTTNIDDIVNEQSTSTELVNKILLNTIKLSIENNANANFDFLSDIELYLKADGLPDIRFAWKNDIQNNTGNSLELILLGENLKSYFKKDQVEITPHFVLRNNPGQDLQIKMEINLHIVADLLESK